MIFDDEHKSTSETPQELELKSILKKWGEEYPRLSESEQQKTMMVVDMMITANASGEVAQNLKQIFLNAAARAKSYNLNLDNMTF